MLSERNELVLVSHGRGGRTSLVRDLATSFPTTRVRTLGTSVRSVNSIGGVYKRLVGLHPSVVVRGTNTCSVPQRVYPANCSGIFRVGFLSPCCVAHRLVGVNAGVMIMNSVTRGCSGVSPASVSFQDHGTSDLICKGSGECSVFTRLRLTGDRKLSLTITRPNVAVANVASRCPG